MKRMAIEGWQGQFRRVERWSSRLADLGSARLGELREEDLDLFWAFCTTAYHLRDWLQADAGLAKADLDALFARTPALRSARDLCIGSKHFDITRPSASAHPAIARELMPGGTCRALVLMDQKYDMLAFVNAVTATWTRFIADQDLMVAA